jgi:hypothetical protein
VVGNEINDLERCGIAARRSCNRGRAGKRKASRSGSLMATTGRDQTGRKTRRKVSEMKNMRARSANVLLPRVSVNNVAAMRRGGR